MKLIVDAGSVRELVSRKSGQIFRKQVGGLLRDGQRVPAAVEWWVRQPADEIPPGEYPVDQSWFRVSNLAIEFQPSLPARASGGKQ